MADGPIISVVTVTRSRPALLGGAIESVRRQTVDAIVDHLIVELRNLAAAEVGGEWLAFIDDDNRWHEDHLSTLLHCAEASRCRAAHSYRELCQWDGSPYFNQVFRGPRTRRRVAISTTAVAAGVMARGSAMIRSTTDPTLNSDLRFVDMGEWLMLRRLLLEIPLVEAFTAEEDRRVGEDDKWAE